MDMKRTVGKLLFAIIVLAFTTCLLYADEPKPGTYGKDVKERRLELPRCFQPIGTIVAHSFKCKAAGCQQYNQYQQQQYQPPEQQYSQNQSFPQISQNQPFPQNQQYRQPVQQNSIGQGMSDMLVTALQQSGCFKVYEREALKEVQEELAMEGVKPKFKGADYILTGSITAFESNETGGSGLGGIIIPGPIPIAVGGTTSKNQAHVGLDIRLIRVKDAEILVSRTVEGKSGQASSGMGGGVSFRGVAIPFAWHQTHKNTPIDEAIRDVLAQGLVSIMDGLKAQGFAKEPSAAPESNPNEK